MKLHNYFVLACIILAIGCDAPTAEGPVSDEVTASVKESKITLDLDQAENLITMPLNCIGVEYPNKLGQTLSAATDLGSPGELHPTFYGCFDWHSAVHGHWSIVYLLKHFPEIADRDQILQQLQDRMSAEKILQEAAYFDAKHNSSYERTYGWAWLLKLSEELYTWDDPIAQELHENLQPLVDKIINGYLGYLPKLNYPIRVGTHTNTAFGLSFAYDYAETVGLESLKKLISERAKEFYQADRDCPIGWEPSGHDFLSPCLEEIDIMRRVLEPEDFRSWLSEFMPTLSDPAFTLAPGIVSDRTDGHLVHLDGLNFSRAWCLYGIAHTLPTYGHLRTIADEHIHHSIGEVVGDDYEGGHWLGSFAIYALHSQN